MRCTCALRCLSSRTCSCCLHAKLNIVALVCKNILTAVPEALAEKVYTYLTGLGIAFSKTKSPTALGSYAQALAEKSFRGDECDKLLAHYVSFLDQAFPAGTNEGRKALLVKVFATFAEAFEAVNQVDDRQAREPQALAVQAKCDAFFHAFNLALSPERASLYVHIIHDHWADEVREFGNLGKMSGQALEHGHAYRKVRVC